MRLALIDSYQHSGPEGQVKPKQIDSLVNFESNPVLSTNINDRACNPLFEAIDSKFKL